MLWYHAQIKWPFALKLYTHEGVSLVQSSILGHATEMGHKAASRYDSDPFFNAKIAKTWVIFQNSVKLALSPILSIKIFEICLRAQFWKKKVILKENFV